MIDGRPYVTQPEVAAQAIFDVLVLGEVRELKNALLWNMTPHGNYSFAYWQARADGLTPLSAADKDFLTEIYVEIRGYTPLGKPAHLYNASKEVPPFAVLATGVRGAAIGFVIGMAALGVLASFGLYKF